MTLADDLRRTFLFEGLSDGQMAWLLDHAAEVDVPAGERILAFTEPADALYVLIAGEMQVTRPVGGREVVLGGGTTPGTWAGWLPPMGRGDLFGNGSAVTCRLLRPSRLLRIPRDAVAAMIDSGFPGMGHLMAGLTRGIQNFEAANAQQQKLAALGKLSAGLAHELNNPAAAARRAVGRLREADRDRDARALALGHRLDPDQAARLAALVRDAGARPPTAVLLGPLDRSDREDALAAWLTDRGVADAYDLAPGLVDAGLEAADLGPVAGTLGADVLPDALAWLGSAVAAGGLATEVERSVARISELVGAIKDYSFMDRTPEQAVDFRKGIDDTLTILAHALRGVAVERDYAPDLPTIRAVGSELNQVWTNLLDNAADALAEAATPEPRIAIRVAADGDGVTLEIADNGPGIPPDALGRVFDPFFTTKPMGQGTGLGLDTSHRIVVRQHNGDLSVTSVPGATRFRVWLPRDPGTVGAGAAGNGDGG